VTRLIKINRMSASYIVGKQQNMIKSHFCPFSDFNGNMSVSYLTSHYWHCSMLVPLSTLLTMACCLTGYKFRLACLETFLVGWVHSSVSTPLVWSMGHWAL